MAGCGHEDRSWFKEPCPKWPGTMDAKIWTEKWMEHITDHPEIPTDFDTMVGWFSNAIMAGYDQGQRDRLVRGQELLVLNAELKEQWKPYHGGGCHILLKGDDCRCHLCLIDRLTELAIKGDKDT